MPHTQVHITNFTENFGGTSHVVTLSATPAAGNLLVCIINLDKVLSAITDNSAGSRVWTQNANGVNYSDLSIQSKVAIGDETTVTVTTGTASGASIVVIEYSGNNGKVTDGANSNTGTSGVVNTPTLVTTYADDLIVVAWGTLGSINTNTWSALGPSTSSPTWTPVQKDNSTETANGGQWGYLLVATGQVSATGSYLATSTFSDNSRGEESVIAAFKAAVAPASGNAALTAAVQSVFAAGITLTIPLLASTALYINAQYALPIADVSTGTWTADDDTTTNLYTHINEDTPDDLNYIKSSTGTIGDVYETSLAPLAQPGAGPLVLRYRYGKDVLGSQKGLIVDLISAGNVIQTWIHADIPDGFTDAVQTVTAPITDYTTLGVRFTAT